MDRKLLCIADETEESRSAVIFAATRAKLNGSHLTILKVLEPPEHSLLSAMGDAIIEDLRLEALDKLQNLISIAKQCAGIDAIGILREGFSFDEISRLIDEDLEIKTLILGASNNKSGPGPLINAAAKGALHHKGRQIAVMIIPAGLSDSEIEELAS